MLHIILRKHGSLNILSIPCLVGSQNDFLFNMVYIYHSKIMICRGWHLAYLLEECIPNYKLKSIYLFQMITHKFNKMGVHVWRLPHSINVPCSPNNACIVRLPTLFTGGIVNTLGKLLHTISHVIAFWVQLPPKSTSSFTLSGSLKQVPVTQRSHHNRFAPPSHNISGIVHIVKGILRIKYHCRCINKFIYCNIEPPSV